MTKQNIDGIAEDPKSKSMSFELFKGKKMVHKIIETIRYKDHYYFVVSGSIGNLLAS